MKMNQTVADPVKVTKQTTNLEVMMNQKLSEVEMVHAKRINDTNPFMDTMLVLFFIVIIVASVSFARSLKTKKI